MTDDCLILDTVRVPVPMWHWLIPAEVSLRTPMPPLLHAILTVLQSGSGTLEALLERVGVEERLLYQPLARAIKQGYVVQYDGQLQLSSLGLTALRSNLAEIVETKELGVVSRGDITYTLDAAQYSVTRMWNQSGSRLPWPPRVDLTAALIQEHLQSLPCEGEEEYRLVRYTPVDPQPCQIRLTAQARYDRQRHQWYNVVLDPDEQVDRALTIAMQASNWAEVYKLQPRPKNLPLLSEVTQEASMHQEAIEAALEFVDDAMGVLEVVGNPPIFQHIEDALDTRSDFRVDVHLPKAQLSNQWQDLARHYPERVTLQETAHDRTALRSNGRELVLQQCWVPMTSMAGQVIWVAQE